MFLFQLHLSNMLNIYSIMRSAPRYLSLRYGELNSYVWESLFPRNYKNRLLSKIKDLDKKKKKIIQMKEIVDEATLLTFIFVTRKIFLEGSLAAKKAVDTLNELGVKEFYLGNTKFTERNENVVLGDDLAQKLFDSLDVDAKNLILNSTYMYDILNKYKNLIKK